MKIICRMKSIKSHITQLLKSLNEGVFEKEHTIALSLLSAMAGESIFLLGPPGVAKSLVARRLKLAFKDADAFDRRTYDKRILADSIDCLPG